MKSLSKTLSFGLLTIAILCGFTSETAMQQSDIFEATLVLKRAKWNGVWDYTVKDVPPEYSKGVLHVTKKKKVYSVQVELVAGTLDAEKVMVEKKNLNFSLNIEGQMVDVALTMDGDTFSGESSSPDGVFPLQGARRK